MQGQVERFFKRHPHWSKVSLVCQKLRSSGYQAFLVGGCVRDALIGREITDFDVATNAIPDQVQEIFPNALEIGKSFGIMMVPFAGFQIEIATFREEDGYSDGRHPTEIKFSSAEMDVKRRDFTVNALFYDTEKKEVLDFVDGLSDLRKGVLKTVGDPRRRFSEDHLRLLRAVRFSTQLGFKIDIETQRELLGLASSISTVSVERQVTEIEKIFCSLNVCRGLQGLIQLQLWPSLFPEFLGKDLLQAEARWYFSMWPFLQQNRHVGWALLAAPYFFELGIREGEEKISSFVKRMKFSRELQRNIIFVTKNSALADSLSRFEQLNCLDHPWGIYWLELWKLYKLWRGESIESLAELVDHFNSVSTVEGQLKPAILKGEDFLKMGIKKGPQMGALISEAYELQLLSFCQDKQELIRRLNLKV